MQDAIIRWAAELQSIAQAGLFYSKDVFDWERYQRIRDIAAEMVSSRTDLPLPKINSLFCGDVGYQTPKVDTRAAIIRNDKILLVRERNDKWSVPGGWCDFNLSPMDNTVKEVKEEAGLDVKVLRLIAVQDRDKHNQPKYIYSIVKIFYLCEAISGSFKKNIETSESRYFGLHELPVLAEEKVNREQIEMCVNAYHDPNWRALFD